MDRLAVTLHTLDAAYSHNNLSYLLTSYSIEQSPWEANRFEASQEIPHILWNWKSSLPHSQGPTTCPYQSMLRVKVKWS
jgi:hypothetical protein